MEVEKSLVLEKSYHVHLKAEGEVCYRLSRGVRVCPVQRKGDWLKIVWRNGKKKGWILKPE